MSDAPDPKTPPGLTAGDTSLFTGPYVELTPERLDALKAGIEDHVRRYREDFPKLLAECPYETKLAVACWVMQQVYAHARDGGTYRYLIYHRLGFGPDAYAPMMFADALNISNEFVVSAAAEADDKIADCLRAAFEPLPVGVERSRLVDAYFRFAELAAFARRATQIIDQQRMEFSQFNPRGTG